jgi:hypothetical protein
VASGNGRSSSETPSLELTFLNRWSSTPRRYWLRADASGSPIAARPRIISESSWDDGLPLRIDNRDGFGGLYLGAIRNCIGRTTRTPTPMVAPTTRTIVGTLDEGDYLVITSTGSTARSRVPARYPDNGLLSPALRLPGADADPGVRSAGRTDQ